MLQEVTEPPDDGAPEDYFWSIKKIVSLHHREPKGEPSIYFLCQYFDGYQCYIDMDTLRLGDPYILIDKAMSKGWDNLPGFEWIKSYLATDEEHIQVLRAFKTRVKSKDGKTFKFGVEVPRSPKHALQLDSEGWGASMKKEIDEIIANLDK